MTRRVSLVGIAVVALAGFALPAHAGGKRLPRAKSIVESIRPAAPQTHYVRTVSAKPAAVQSPVLTPRDYNQSHYLREGAPAR